MRKCYFCQKDTSFIYKLNGYDIYQCKHCKTVFAGQMPTDEELAEYYDGFKFSINESYENLFLDKRFYNWFKSFNLPAW